MILGPFGTAGTGAKRRRVRQRLRPCGGLVVSCGTPGIAKAAGLNIREWYFAVVEKAAPYTCAIYSLDQSDLDAANDQLEEAYRMVQSCQELGTYPGYTPQEPMKLSLSQGL